MADTPAVPILIVEDDEPTQRLLEALLRRSGLVTEIASDGARAIALLKQKTYAAVVLDIMMPDVSGRDVIEFLSKSDIKAPVIICSAAGPAALSGFDPKVVKAVVRKPFDIDYFVDAIRSIAFHEPSRVLIIDDDERDRYTMRLFAQPHEILEAETGDAALQMIREARPDLVLLDLILPGISGEEVLERMEADETMRDVPVVIVTHKKLGDQERSALAARTAAVIYKGHLSRETLTAAISHAKKLKARR